MDWADVIRAVVISLVPLLLSFMVASIWYLKNEETKPAPMWVNGVFSLGFFILALSVASTALERATAPPTIGLVMGLAGLVIASVGAFFLAWSFKPKD